LGQLETCFGLQKKKRERETIGQDKNPTLCNVFQEY